MKLLEQIVNQRINRITKEELLKYSKEYGYSISTSQAEKIVLLLRGKNVNIFNSAERAKLIKEIAKITSPAVAKELNQLFLQFTGTN
ncbi:DUF2624 domain-containing protein [Bacillus sp. BGMRC 2118]|nr:DUF2624 domain-containing protein [Bacillus sp. BGMRC 2118]